MYYSITPNLDKGEAGMLGRPRDFSCVPEGVSKKLGRRRMPFSEKHCSNLSGAGWVVII